MAIQLKRSSAIGRSGVKLLVYGAAGAGKTSLIPTLPKPIVLSAEGGLLSIADADVPFIEIKSIADLHEAYAWLVGSAEATRTAYPWDGQRPDIVLVVSHEKRRRLNQFYNCREPLLAA